MKKKVFKVLLSIIVVVSVFGIAGVGLKSARQNARIQSDVNVLKNVGISMRMFTAAYDDNYPVDLAMLWEDGFMQNGQLYVATGKIHKTPIPKEADDIRNGFCDLLFLGTGKKEGDLGRDDPLLCTKPGIYGDETIIVTYGDGHVVRHDSIPPRVQKAIEEHDKWWKEFHTPVRGYIDIEKNKEKLFFDYIYYDLRYKFKPGKASMVELDDKRNEIFARKTDFKLSEKSDSMLLTILNIIERDKLYTLNPRYKCGHGYHHDVGAIYNTGLHSGNFDIKEPEEWELTLFKYRVELLLHSLQTDLMLAVRKGDLQEVTALLKAGVAINAQDRHGRTPLIIAVKHRYTDIISLLLAEKADINILDWDDNSVLDHAKREINPNSAAYVEGPKEIIQLLQKHGAKPGKKLKAEKVDKYRYIEYSDGIPGKEKAEIHNKIEHKARIRKVLEKEKARY